MIEVDRGRAMGDAERGSLDRGVYLAQLLVPFLMPWIFFVGRLWLGAPSGWLSGPGLLLIGPPMAIALGIPVIVSLRDRGAYSRRRGERGYTVASLVPWAALLAGALTVTDAGAPRMPTSVLGVWTGGAVSEVASQYLFFICVVAAVVAWATALVLAIRGVFVAHRNA